MPPPEPPDPAPTPARVGVSEAVEGASPPSLVPPEGMAARLLELGEQLRAEGVAVGTSELLDAFAVLREIPWTSQAQFREALAATLAKSQEDRRTYELVFDRFFFRAVEIESVRQGVKEETGSSSFDLSDLSENELDALRRQIAEALRDGAEGAMRDLARMAIATFGQAEQGSGVIGVDVQRIRRALGLRAEPQPELPEDDPRRDGVPRDALRRFEALMRRELERTQVQRSGRLPPARPLGELDRALPSGPLADLAAVHRVVVQLRRRLATQGKQNRGHRRHAHVDVRRTMRASLQTGGVPVELRFRPRRPKRPEIYVLCDVSTSVTSASVFFLSVLHALHDSFRKMRSFVFIERISEVTDVFEHERDFKAVSERISNDAGVADISGYTDYGRVWMELLELIQDDMNPRATVIVLGDARTNGRDPRADLFGQVAARAGRTFWLNPEPRLYWNYGDSVIAAYEEYCTAFECWTTAQLEDFVKALTRPVVSAGG
ncbi:MAG: VWA domain-containing protein [Solirubrobacteraceae bacterium]